MTDNKQCYDTDTQSFDISRFTTDYGPSCYSYACPKCDCDGRNVGEIWYVKYQGKCRQCECKTASYYHTNYADCDYVHDYKSTEPCPPEDNQYLCHINSRPSSMTII